MASKYSEWNRGQDEALLNKLGGMDVALKLLDCSKVTVTFDEKKKQATIVAVPSEKQTALRRRDVVQLPGRTEAFDPDQYFRTRGGLYVWDDFGERIVAAAKSVASVPAMKIASLDLFIEANDKAIQGELPAGYLFEDPSVFCAYLAGMLERQAGGKDGDLITTGRANIFYVRGFQDRVFAVDVYWDRYGREWDVNANPLSDDPWDADDRAFSRSC